MAVSEHVAVVNHQLHTLYKLLNVSKENHVAQKIFLGKLVGAHCILSAFELLYLVYLMGKSVEVALELHYILSDLKNILFSFIEGIILLLAACGALYLIFVDIREHIVLDLCNLGELAL